MIASGRLRVGVVLWWCTSIAGTSSAQQPAADTLVPLAAATMQEPAMRRPVRVNVDSVALAAAIRRVATSVGVDFMWDASLPELRRPVSLHAETITLAAAVMALVERGGAESTIEVLVSPPATLVIRARNAARDASEARDRQVKGGTLAGVVENAATGEPVAGASVQVGDGRGAWTDAAGRFAIRDLPVGLYTLLARRLGYAPVRIAGVGVPAGGRGSLMLLMRPTHATLAGVVITTATYSAFDDVGRPPAVTREHLAAMPQLAEDALRAVARLPGVASDDFGARLHVRGGTGDDVLVTIDGLELIEPFHLRELGGTVSLVDARTVGMLQLAAGDFGADYGNRLAGVVAIRSIDPDDGSARDDAAIDRLHASARSRGTFAHDRGAWLVAARYGFPGRALRQLDPDGSLHSRYADVFAKTRFIARADTFALHVLGASDRMQGAMDETDSVRSSAQHLYLWATARHPLGPLGARGDVRQVLSVGEVRTRRRASGVTADTVLLATELPVVQDVNITDARTATVAAYRQDWRIVVADPWAARLGFEAARHGAEYDYLHTVGAERTASRLGPAAWVVGAYTTQQFPLGPATIAEIGARYDAQSSTGEATWSPRVHVAHALAPRTTLRAAWGRYAQFERAYELQVENRDTVFELGDRAEHRGIGLEHELRRGLVLRAEVYERSQPRVRPRFFEPLLLPNLTPEGSLPGMIRLAPRHRRARGVEVSAATSPGRALSWGAAYAYSSTRDTYDDRVAPSPFDQRHSVNLESSYTIARQWRLGASWQFRSGWPFTETSAHLVITGDTLRLRTGRGPINGARLPPYHRLDVRAERTWVVGRGRVSTYVDVFNAYDRRNQVSRFSLDVQGIDEAPAPIRAEIQMLRFLPSVGVRWEF
jgi:hypothetical protein